MKKLLLLLMLLTCSALAQNQYFVSTTGNDANNGTSSGTAWRTIAHADTALALGSGVTTNCGASYFPTTTGVGTCVHIAGGTYSQGEFTTNHNGTTSQKIVFICDIALSCLIRGTATGGSGVWLANGANSQVIGFDVAGTPTYGIKICETGSGGCPNIVVGYNHVHDLTGACANSPGGGGITGANAITSLIIGNEIDHIDNTAGGGRWCHGIYMGGSVGSPSGRIYNNLIHDNTSGYGVNYDEDSSVGSNWADISNNTILWTGSNSIDCTISGDSCGGGIIVDTSRSGGAPAVNMTIDNNLIAFNPGTGRGIGGLQNIDSSHIDGNLMFGNTVNTITSVGSGTTTNGTINSDPQLQCGTGSACSGTGKNYRLKSISPAVGSGFTVCAANSSPCVPTIDITGLTRPSPLSTGAYDLVSSTNIYVSATGSGTLCSSASPCTVSQGMSNFSSGTAAVIHFANGTYAPGIDIIKSGGSPSNRLVLQCDNGIPSATVAVNKCKITGASAGFIVEGSNIDIVGFDIGGNANMNVCATTLGSSVRIIGNYCHDLGSNVWNDAHTALGCPEAGAFNIGASSTPRTDQQVLRNWIHHFGAAGPLANCNVAQGISGHGTPFIVQDNLIDGVPVAGIQLHDSCNSVITNNTVIFVKQGIILGDVDGTCGTYGKNTIANNYFAALFGTGSIFNTGNRAHCTSTSTNLFSHNMSDGGLPDFAPGSGPFSCDVNTPSSWTHQAGSSFFVNYLTDGSGDYHLKAGSAGIGGGGTACTVGGTTPCVPSTDFEVNTMSNPPPVGAYTATAPSSSNIFVSASGSGTACSSGTPCTVTQGFTNYAAGTAATMHFADGSYSSFLIPKGGSASSRLVMQCDNGIASATAAIGHCNFHSHDGANRGIVLETPGVNYLDIIGFDVGSDNSMATGIIVAGGHNCGTSGNFTCGVGVRIIGNYVHDMGSSITGGTGVLGCPSAGGIEIGSHDGTIPAPGVQILRNLVLRYGTVNINCNQGGGIYADTGNVVIQNNIVGASAGWNIQYYSSPCKGVISNNTLFNAGRYNVIVDASNSPCTNGNNTISNNTMFAAGAVHIDINSNTACSSTSPNLWINNIIDNLVPLFGPAPSSCNTVTGTLTSTVTSTFVNYQASGSGDYHLSGSSAAAGAGSNTCVSGGISPCTPTTDFAGTTRPVPPSIGAYEGTASSPLRTYYVSSTGTDSNSGTSSGSAWLTLSHASTALAVGSQGTVVNVAAGTYNSGQIVTAQSGTSNAARIRFQCTTKWTCNIRMNTGTATSVWLVTGNFVDIDGFDISQTGVSTANFGINMNASNIRVTNNRVHDLPGDSRVGTTCNGGGGAGIVAPNVSSTSQTTDTISGNIVFNIGAAGFCSNVYGIWAQDGGPAIYNNEVYKVASYGIACNNACISAAISNNTIFSNGGNNGSTSMGGCILLGSSATGTASDINNNICKDNGASGSGASIVNGGGTLNNYQVANNLIQNSASGNGAGGAQSCSSQSLTDNFATGTLNSSLWTIDTGSSPPSPNNTGTFVTGNVSLSQGMLDLKLVQTAGTTATSVGGELRSIATYGYGTYQWTARMGSSSATPNGGGAASSGQVSGLFNYFQNSGLTAPNFTEDDFEVEGRLPTQLEMTSWTSASPVVNTSTNQTESGMDTAFHTYKFVWAPGQIDYYFDGTLVSSHVTNVPTNPAFIIMNLWGTNSNTFGGTATTATRHLYISNFTFTPAATSCISIGPGSSQVVTNNLINLSPGFINYQANGSGNYGLVNTSPAVHTGTKACVTSGPSPCTPSTDINGVSRPVSPSIGAVEFTGTVQPTSDYYVSPTGNDSNPGTIGSPWLTIQKCTTDMVVGGSGATCHVAAGSYAGPITIATGGTSASARVTYVSDTKWAAQVSASKWTINNSTSHVSIIGFDMTGPTSNFAVLIGSGSDRIIQYNYIHDFWNSSACPLNGIIHETTSPSSSDIIDGNVMRHMGNSSCAGGSGFMAIYADGSGIRITNNVISGLTGGWAIQKQYASITDCTPGVISNNTIFNNQGGIVLNDEGNACAIRNWTITNNIIVNNGVAGTGQTNGSAYGINYYNFTGNGSTIVQNNLIYGNLPGNFANHSSACTPGTANCPSTNTVTDSGVTATFTNFQLDTNTAPAASYNVNNYKPKGTSNAAVGGTATCATGGLSPCVPSLDVIAVQRNAPFSIGAFEVNGTTPPTGSDFYVSPAGSDSTGDGSQSSPWATIPHCIANFVLGPNGATCHVLAGTYSSGINLNRGGSSASIRFILQCDPGASDAATAQGKCKITGSSDGINVASGTSFTDIIGFDIGGNTAMSTAIFGIGGSTGTSLHILRNYIHDLAQTATGPEGVGCPQSGAILTNNGSAHGDYQIIGNIIKNYGKYPFPSCFNAHGIYSAANSIIEANLIIAVPTASIQVHSDFCNTVISNNTLISAQTAILGEGAAGCTTDGQPVGKNTIRNNLSFNMSKWHFQNGVFNGGTPQCTSGTPNLWANNITDGINSDFSANYLASCDTQSPQPFIHASGASVFVNYKTDGTGNYHLINTSPALAAGGKTCTTGGTTPCVPSVDITGKAYNTVPSAGAYEGGTSLLPPPAPTNLRVFVRTLNEDMLNWVLMGTTIPDRRSQNLGGAFSYLDGDSVFTVSAGQKLWLIKNVAGNPWDLDRYDSTLLYLWITENGEQAPTNPAAYKRFLTPVPWIPRFFAPNTTVTFDSPGTNQIVRTINCEADSQPLISIGHIRTVTSGPVSHPWGGDVGTQPTIEVDYFWGGSGSLYTTRERFFFVKFYGRTQWDTAHWNGTTYQIDSQTTHTTLGTPGSPDPNWTCGFSQPWWP